jgi:hypothetical protein
VVTVPGYRFKGHGFDFWRYQIFYQAFGLEQGPLGFLRITEELLERKKIAAPVKTAEINGRGGPLR